MTPAQVRSLVSRYISERLDEWEEFFTSSSSEDQANGLGTRALSRGDERTAACGTLRFGDETAVHEFMKRYKVSVVSGSPAYRILWRALVKAEKVIQAEIKEIA
jgi:hypothetical protein